MGTGRGCFSFAGGLHPGGGAAAGLAVAVDDVFVGTQLRQPHGAAGVELLGADAHLTPQTELSAVGEPGGGVHIHRRAVHAGGKAVRRNGVRRHNTFAVMGGMAGNVADGFVHIVHHGHRKDVPQKFGVKVPLPGGGPLNDGGGAAVQATAEELARIERVNIFKTKATDNKPSVILCVPTIDGNRLQAREVNQQQWQRMWLADDKQDYKTHLAASLFADVLRKERTDAVAVGTDKTEQEAQSETKEQTKNVEAHEEEDKKEEQKEEQTQSEKKQEEEKRRNSPEQKEKERKEEKAKEEATKAETKAVAAVVLSPIMKQFLDLKSKHPDALLLFRTGDFYETYQQDAEKASKILGITLTKSTKQKGPDGNAVKMAGFPYHALDTYLPKLIRAGERVAICDQLEAPKQTAKRGISELVSPGVASEKEAKAEPEKHQAFHR